MGALFASPVERYVTFVGPLAPEARTVIGAGGAEIGGGAGAALCWVRGMSAGPPRSPAWLLPLPLAWVLVGSLSPVGGDEEKRNINWLLADSRRGTDPATSGGGGNVSSDRRRGVKIGGPMDVLKELLGESPGIEAVRKQIRRLLERAPGARHFPPILINGETGTGKGLIARLIHRLGPRSDGPFVDVNCAAIPETLLEAELFGVERGAFTDARQPRPGLFQAAQRGTIFLDEIGLLPEGLQAKLLKVIEERAVRRLGSTRSEAVDVWILTATNEDLELLTSQRRFREDLYHRLAVLTLSVPPLRGRADDILPLAEHFLARACAEYDLPPKSFTPDARAALLVHRWPGNVR